MQQEENADPSDTMRGPAIETAGTPDLAEAKRLAGLPLAENGTSSNKNSDETALSKEVQKEVRVFGDLLARERAFKSLSVKDTVAVYNKVRTAFEKYLVEKIRKIDLLSPEMGFSGEKEFIEAIQSFARSSADSLPHGQGVADALGSFLKAHFARAKAQETPPVPERKYVPRQDEIIPFLREVWADWLAGGHLARQTLYDHDPAAYSALSNWLRNNELPDDMDIPSNREITDRELENEWFHREDVPRIASAIGRRARFPR